MSDTFQTEMRIPGIESSPAFVRAPEGNRCAERFIRTLKENLLWIRSFDTVEELRLALLTFRDIYNTTWLIQRLDLRASCPGQTGGLWTVQMTTALLDRLTAISGRPETTASASGTALLKLLETTGENPCLDHIMIPET
jgi:hypothetical protein